MNEVAIITGASSGIGAAFARKLASLGYDLVIAGRRVHLLDSLKEELEEEYSIAVEVFLGDFREEEVVLKFEDLITTSNNLTILVNNAGYGIGDTFTSKNVPIKKSLDLVNVHVLAPVRFTKAAINNMERRTEGYIINVASLAAIFPSGDSLYCPSKLFLISFSACLNNEMIGKKLKTKIQALCPGYVRTDFHSRGTYDTVNYDELEDSGLTVSTPQEVVEKSLQTLFDRNKTRTIVVPGYEVEHVKYLFENSFLAQELEE